MSNILVLAEHNQGQLKSSTLELLTVASQSKSKVFVALFGPQAETSQTELSRFGVQKAFVFSNETLKSYHSEIFAALVSDLIKNNSITVVLSSGTSSGRDLLPRLAARFGSGIISDATHLQIDGGNAVCKKPYFAGKCTAQVSFKSSPVQFVVMRPNQLQVQAPASGSTCELVISKDIPSLDLRSVLKNVVKDASTKLDLTEANIIVSGGRGMKGPEHFKLLHDLADVLGATVGASRAVVDSGWVPHSMQVGQTGKTVAPTLYIACGISGAIQHLAGMSSSKVIVAINKDPEAPIFKKATYGIVGDAFEVLPLLTEEFKKILAH